VGELLLLRFEQANNFAVASGFIFHALLHGCVRLKVKFDFLIGLLMRGLEVTGTGEFRGVQSRVGEMICYRDMLASFVDSMVDNPTPWSDGSVIPNIDAVSAYRVLATIAYPRAKEIFQQDLGSALIYNNSNAVDWKNPDISRYLGQYLRGSGGKTGIERA
jgi:4-hydroxyphenylacetate 3-monooxygenase